MKRFTLRRPVIIALLALLNACSGAQSDGIVATHPMSANAPLTCTTDAQCAVKNVGNCCGESLACVHVDQAVDPAAVKRRCADEALSSVCGFREIRACSCDAGQCVESKVGNAESLQ